VVNTKTGRKVVFSTQQHSFEPSALEDIEVAFATTIHKSQGATYNFPYTIHQFNRLDERLRYVALTRATDMKFINIV
jgi:ATP-dependent exoDNAse (exonuclease V) alpha subunit